MKKKSLIAILVIAVLVAALVAVYFVTRPETNTDMKSFEVHVVGKDLTTLVIPMESDAEYLGPLLLEKGIIKGEQGQYGLYIQEVNGIKAVFEEDGAYWAFYVDGEYALQGIDQTPIEAGKVYKLAYTIDTQS